MLFHMNKLKDNSRVYFGNSLPPAGEYVVDPVHSFAEFAVQHLVVGQVWGRFNSISGQIRIADEPLLSTFEFSIDTASIDTHHPGRDADLRSPKFFDVQKYPKMTFSSTRIKVEPGGNFTVEGNFTIRAITRKVSVALKFTGVVQDPWGNTRIAFQTKIKVNRKDFGLLTNLEKETGGLPIGKDVSIKTAIEATLKK
jgi:polyisoprenoid-binding protein YceI